MRYILMILLFFPFSILAQSKDTAKVLSAVKASHNIEDTGWVYPYLNWRYHVGDNPEWAKPAFDDASWPHSDLTAMPYGTGQIPDGSIVWLRMTIINDSSFMQPLVMRIWQSGASQIYLNGKLIHSIGVVSANDDSSAFFNPGYINYDFPLLNDSVQVWSVRFKYMPVKYPLFLNKFDKGFYPRIAKLNNATDDFRPRKFKAFNLKMAIGLGIATLLGILFLSLFLFFKKQKVNLFFSLCCFFLAIALSYGLVDYTGEPTFYNFSLLLFQILYLSLLLYCTYKIFNQELGKIFWTIVVIGLLQLPFYFIVQTGFESLVFVFIIMSDGFRVTTKVLKYNKEVGARILQICYALNIIFWILNFLTGFKLITIPGLEDYNPYGYVLGPVALAIYIGYSFGNTSQKLRQKLAEVERLSGEKQQILALQNETLEQQVEERTAALNKSLQELKSTQSQLIQSEKMASLGELTAGIAHEIQNPLNFVNNFSEVSNELIDEMNEELNKGDIEVAKIISNDIKQNLEKINHHGKRADAIVKGMLQHSQTNKGQNEATDINALADEYFRLAYHGLRAKDKNFNATLKTDFDESISKINIIPQDMGRVLLNLITNAFYAVDEKRNQAVEGYEPTVSITTKKINNTIEIKVADNGNGIPQNIVDKIFQPFFTTKPTGQGTGLGLSLAYDIVKAHGGAMKVETKEEEETTFIIQLPTN